MGSKAALHAIEQMQRAHVGKWSLRLIHQSDVSAKYLNLCQRGKDEFETDPWLGKLIIAFNRVRASSWTTCERSNNGVEKRISHCKEFQSRSQLSDIATKRTVVVANQSVLSL